MLTYYSDKIEGSCWMSNPRLCNSHDIASRLAIDIIYYSDNSMNYCSRNCRHLRQCKEYQMMQGLH